MVDVLDGADAGDNGGAPEGWYPDGSLTGLPEMNAAAAQSTLPALMTPEQRELTGKTTAEPR